MSVLILTYNEEVNIERCLDSVQWSHDVVVLDSFSTDRTLELAGTYSNVRILQRPFTDYSDQRNFGLHEVKYSSRWVLMLDADEAVEPALAAELLEVAGSVSYEAFDVFFLRRKVIMDGSWIRWNVSSGVWIGRLIRPEAVRFQGTVHEKPCFRGRSGLLRGRLEHHQFSKGLEHWLQRRVHYARLEAEERRAQPPEFRLRQLLSRNRFARRSALKSLYLILPARWIVYLVYSLVCKAAYLGGLKSLRYIYLEAYSQRFAARQLQKDRDV